MTVYSHSRLSCYEQCPAKFKYQYIEKVETEEAETVEAFLGVRVHESLEKLYRDLGFQKQDSLDELLDFFRAEWVKNWSDDIVIVKDQYTSDNYQRMGEKYLSDYYERYHPFTQGRTIALEERITICLDPAGEYKMQGFIDRLSEAKDGFYEIHDYKTNSRLPLPEYLASDRQLALYMIGVQTQYPDVRDVRLIWHFLKFDKEVDSTRTQQELEGLKHSTIQLIDRIESETQYKAAPGFLCEWCEYQSVCGQWKHLHMIREKPANEYMNDSGVVLVNKYAELKQKQKVFNNEVDEEVAKLEDALISFAAKEKVECVFGEKNKVRITDGEKYSFPGKNTKERKQLEDLIKRMGVWAEVDQLDTTALGKLIQEKQCTKEFLDAVRTYVDIERKKRLYLSKMKDEKYHTA